MSKYFSQLFSFLQILLLWQISLAAEHHVVKSLPGYPGNLPFHLETGYVGVGESEEVQLFYYFVESESDPEGDPLLLWLTGGPGCSALSGLAIEIGPLTFVDSPQSWQSEIPMLQSNPYTWTKVASVLFVEAPVGTGFSYATSNEAYYSSDIAQASDIYEFLRKWLMDRIEFRKNPLYITGDSYAGRIIPIVVQNIINGMESGVAPQLNLKGYVIGNPVTTKDDATKSRYEYSRRVSLLSDELFETTGVSCMGTYEVSDVDNIKCQKNIQAILNDLQPVFAVNVLEPACLTPQTLCRETSYKLLEIWANKLKVQEALHIRTGTKSHWIRCNESSAYTYNVDDSFIYHKNLTKLFMRALIYSGDQDMKVSYVGTIEWIKKLAIPIIDDWHPWFVKGQVAGYKTEYSNGHYKLMFTTIKGGGHTAPEYKRHECLNMITKWLGMNPL